MKKRYWYRQYLGECPVCGSDKSYRERVYGKKPKNNKKIYVFIPAYECYLWCLER
jgi:hypothetical protein